MKKKLTLTLAVLALTLVTATTSQAADKNMYLSFLLGGAYEHLDTGNTQAKFTSTVPLDFTDSREFQGRLGHYYNANLGVELMADTVRGFKVGNTAGVQDRLRVEQIGINGKWRFGCFPRFRPYLSAGIGWLHAGERIDYKGQSLETSDKGMAWRGAIGYDYMLKDSFSIGIEGAYTRGTSDVDHIKYVSFISSLSYYF